MFSKRYLFSRFLRVSLLAAYKTKSAAVSLQGGVVKISTNVHLIINFSCLFFIFLSPRPATSKYYSTSCKLHLNHSKLASSPSRPREWSNYWLQSTVRRRKRNSTKTQFFRTSQRVCIRSDGLDAFYQLLHSSFGIH